MREEQKLRPSIGTLSLCERVGTARTRSLECGNAQRSRLHGIRFNRNNSVTLDCDTGTLQEIGYVAAVFAAVGAFVAAFFASRSATAATRSADAQTRPLFSDVLREHYTDQERELILPSGEISRSAITGDIRADHQKGWISLPIRNTGKGLARITRVRIEVPGVRGPREAAAGAVPRTQVQPGEEVRITVALSADDEAHEKFVNAIAAMEPIIVEVQYTDFASHQTQLSYFKLGSLPSDLAWRVTDLWTKDGRDKR